MRVVWFTHTLFAQTYHVLETHRALRSRAVLAYAYLS